VKPAVKAGKKYLAAIAVLELITIVVLCMLLLRPHDKPVLTVFGDVDTVYTVDSLKGFNTEKVSRDGRSMTVIALSEIAKKADPRSGEYDVCFIGEDGFTAQTEQPEGIYLALSRKHGWEVVCPDHPPTTAIRNVAKILILDRSDGSGVALVKGSENQRYSVGQLYLMSGESRLLDGESNKQGKTVKAYIMRNVVQVKELTEADSICVMGNNGAQLIDRNVGRLEIKENTVDYVAGDGRQRVPDIAGIYSDPPPAMITDTAADAMCMLESGQRVMIIELDGLGITTYMAGEMRTLESLGNMMQALSVYKPVSPAGLAAMLTGVTGDQNGIVSRERELKVPDLFERAAALGKKCAYVEGDAALIRTSLSPRLCVDVNKNGSTDDEVLAAAIEEIGHSPDLLFIHFHGIDDTSHTHGPLSEETKEKMRQLDGYIAQLAALWGDGRIIVTSDHGQHEGNGADNHGDFRYEDLTVPYIIK